MLNQQHPNNHIYKILSSGSTPWESKEFIIFGYVKRLYIIAGCNGAGKTTASYTILPEILDCKEFVNADEIAKGLSPFQPEGASIQAGRVMLSRIKELITRGETFAYETTLSTRSYVSLIRKSQQLGYRVILLFFWLNSEELAIKRVQIRVQEGGHGIPEDVIRRRYTNGLKNFFNLYKPLMTDWMLIDNSGEQYQIIAECSPEGENILDLHLWNTLQQNYHE